jgi:UDP-N-acetylglucosamine 2-epimerase (non-hydrolysing)
MIHFIIGTKAQLIKMAPIMYYLGEKKIRYNYIFTGQHKETITDIQKNFNIKGPDHYLYNGHDIIKVSDMFLWATKCFVSIYKNKKLFFQNDKNGIILVHGDTASTVLGAVIGKMMGYKIAHIESGLRSFSLFQPFPEEFFRRITFCLSDYYFCQNKTSINNLKTFKGIKINTLNNTLYDALKLSLHHLRPQVQNNRNFGIVSLHRFENFSSKCNSEKIIDILLNVSKTKKLFFIMHKRTENKLKKYKLINLLEQAENIEIHQRYPYFEFINLLNNSEFIISDGGSNQEECYYLGKPIILLRYVTERNEGLNKNALLSNFNLQKIEYFLDNLKNYTYPFLELNSSPSKIIIKYLKPFY